jgi:O-antigen/teichoic acid export membrane protein
MNVFSIVNFLFASGLRAASSFVIFFMYLIVARNSSQEEAGKFYYIHTIVIVLSPMILWGVQQLIVRNYSRLSVGVNYSSILNLLKIYFSAAIYTIPLGLGLCFLFLWKNSIGLWGVFLTWLSVCIMAIIIMFSSFLQANSRFNPSIIFLNLIVPSVFVILFVSSDLSTLYSLSSAILISLVFLCVYFWYLNDGKVVSVDIKLNSRERNQFAFIGMFTLLFNWAGVLIVGRLMTEHDVALLSASQRIATLSSFFLIISNTLISPKISKLFSQGEMVRLSSLLGTSNRLLIIVSVPIFLFVIVFGKWLLSYFGEEYKASYDILIIYTVAQLVNVFFGNCTAILAMTGGQRELLMAMGLGSFVSVVGGVFMAMYFGLVGVAYSFLLAMIIMNFMCIKSIKKNIGYRYFSELINFKFLRAK